MAASQRNIVRHRTYQNRVIQSLARVGFGLLLVLSLAAAILYTRAGTRAYAAPNAELNFQARLLSGTGSIAPDGSSYNVQFKLYNVASGGTAEWTETLTGVTVKNGYLSVHLGTVTPFPGTIDWSQQQWLTMNVNSDGEMSPRLQLTSVPAAFHANEADGLRSGANVLGASDFAQLAPSSAQVINSALAALRLNQTGAGGILQLQHNGSDIFTIAQNGDVASSGSGTFSGGTLNVGAAAQAGGLNIFDGSGQKATISTANLTTDRTFTLPDASGTFCLTGTCFAQGGNAFSATAVFGTTDSNDLQVVTANTQAIRIDASGNVRIGGGSATEKLDVNGGIRVGNSSNTNAGTIRWTGTDFEGYNGTQWKSLTQGGGGSNNATASFVSGLANVAANGTGVAVETLLFTSATAVSNTAGVTGFTAPADGSFRTCLVKNNAVITGGTLNLRWRVNGASVGSGACTMNSTTNRQSATALDTGVVTFSAGDTIGVAFDSVSLAPTTNDFTVYWTVEYETSSGGGGGASTLQEAYDGSTSPATIASADGKNLKVSLNNTTTDANFLVDILTGSTGKFAVQDNGTDALSVTSSGITLSKVVTASAGIDLSNSGITNAGNITGVGTNLTAAAGLTIASSGTGNLTLNAASGLTILGTSTLRTTDNLSLDLNKATDTVLTLSNGGAGIANFNVSDGALQTAGTTRLTNGGALQNITGLNIISGGASISGNVTLGGSSSDRITLTGQLLGANPFVFQGATDNSFATTLSIVDPTANNTITFPDSSGTLVLDSRTITAGTGLSGGGDLSVNRTLSLDINGLSTTTAINSSDTLAIYDGSGVKKITRSDFLQGLTGALQYQGTWDASTNTPTLSDATGNAGEIYAVSAAGTQDLGSGNVSFGAGDFVIHNGSVWQRAPSSSAVSSVFGRTGAVTSQNGDYTASQITNVAAGNISSATVQAALNELDTEKLGSLNGLTSNSQTFANDTNVTITSSGSTHTLGWSGQLSVSRGGTGANTFTSNGVLFGNGSGALQVTSAGTGGQLLLVNASGVPTFTTLSGDATISDTGVLTIGADKVALSTDTTGDYVASLGTLTGLSATGNSGEGSTPSLSVIYGSGADTAVQGNTTITVSAGTNLSGGGNITLGAGGTVTVSTVANPTFGTSVTTPLLTNAGALTLSTTGAGNDLTLESADKIILTGFDCSGFDNGGVLSVNSSGELVCDNDDGGTGGSITGSGTTDRIAFYTGTNSLGSSWLLQDTSTLRLDSGRDFDLVSGNLQLAGTTILTSGAALQNLTGITSSGTITFSSLSAGGLVKADTSGALDIAVAGTDYELPLTFSNGLTRTSNAVALGGSLTGLTDIATGSNNLTISGNGLIGIGSTSAAYKLDLRTPSVLASQFHIAATNTDAGGYLLSVGDNHLLASGGTSFNGANWIAKATTASIFGSTLAGSFIVQTDSGLTPGSAHTPTTRFTVANNGTVTIGSTLAVNGSNLSSSASAFTLLTGPTTVTAFSAATTLGLGTASGTTTINGNTLTSTGLTFAGAGASTVQAANNQNLTINTQGSGVLALNTGSTGNLTTNASTIQRSGTTGLSLDLVNTGTTTLTVTNSDGSNVANLSVEGGITAGTNSSFSVNTDGDITGAIRQLDGSSTANGSSGLGSSTSLTLTSAANFDVGNYVRVSSANCGGSGINPCYAKITAKATNTLTISPALTWANGSAVVEFHIPEIGGVDTSQALANRYGRGYFISGVATGNGTTYYNENSIETNLATFDFLSNALNNPNLTSILIGNSTTTTTIAGSVTYTGNVTAPSTGTAGYLQRSGTTLSPANAGDAFTTSGNISTTGSGTITSAGAISAPTATNTINGLIINSGSLSGITGFSQASGTYTITGSGAITIGGGSNALTIDSTNFDVSSAGALSGITTINASGAITAATSTNTINGLIINSGALSGISTINGSGLATVAGLNAGSGLIQNTGGITSTGSISLNTNASTNTTNIGTGTTSGQITIGGGTTPLVINSTAFDVSSAGALSGITSISASGAITAATATNTINGLIINSGSLSGITGFTQTSGNVAISGTGTLSTGTGNISLNGSTTIAVGKTLTFNSDVISDLTGNGLALSSGSLTLSLDSGSGLSTSASGLSLLRTCSNSQILKWGGTSWACAADSTGLSDSSLKTNVTNLSSTLDAIKNVRVVTYNFDCNNPIFVNYHFDCNSHTGIIAQELGAIFPGLTTLRSDGLYEVNFGALNFYTLKAVVEIAQFIDSSGNGSFTTVKTGGVQRINAAGALTNITGITFTSGSLNLANGGIANTGSIAGATTINASGLATLSGGATISGGTVNINAGGLLTNTNINTGLSTGTVTIGGGTAPLVINSTAFDVSSTGALSGISTVTASGAITTSGNVNVTGTGVYQVDGASGISLTCTSNQYVNNAEITGGIVTGSAGCRSAGLSDQRLKTNIVTLDDSILDKIKEVNAVSFDFDCENTYFTDTNTYCDQEHQTGVIAQELAQVFPDLVTQNSFGYYEVNYQGLSVYNLKAVGELSKKVDAINTSTSTDNGVTTGGTLRLDQNGLLQNITGLAMTSGGATLAGGLNNTGGGITNAGAISGATIISAETIKLEANATDNMLELKKDGQGVFTVFNDGSLELKADSAHIFTVKDIAGNSIFNIDSQTGQVSVGSGNTNKTVLFKLDDRSLPDDPPGTNGSSYYNTVLQRFRCYQDGMWGDCLPVGDLIDPIALAQVNWQVPSAEQEFLGTPRAIANYARTHEFRLRMRVTNAAPAGATCHMQYALTDDGPWKDLADDPAHQDLKIDTAGTLKTDWIKIAKDARTENTIVRVVCKGGNSSQTVTFYGVSIQLR